MSNDNKVTLSSIVKSMGEVSKRLSIDRGSVVKDDAPGITMNGEEIIFNNDKKQDNEHNTIRRMVESDVTSPIVDKIVKSERKLGYVNPSYLGMETSNPVSETKEDDDYENSEERKRLLSAFEDEEVTQVETPKSILDLFGDSNTEEEQPEAPVITPTNEEIEKLFGDTPVEPPIEEPITEQPTEGVIEKIFEDGDSINPSFFETSTSDVPKEERKNLNYADEIADMYYDKETLSKDNSNIMLVAIENYLLTPQYDRDGNMYFNPNGSVSRAEAINALEQEGKKGKSLDGLSNESHYFNEGYNELVDSTESNFYKLYSSDDLDGNIRRLELAYMVASHKGYELGNDYSLRTGVGNLYQYDDMKKIELTVDTSDSIDNLIPKDYSTIEDYFYIVRNADERLPVALVILTHDLVELGYYDDFEERLENLHPLKGVSRLEFAKYIVKLKNLID